MRKRSSRARAAGPSLDAARLPIAAQKGLRCALAKLRDEMVALRLVDRHGADALALDHGGAGIVDGTEQAGDVAQRAGLGAAFGDRGCRLALEIDDVGVAARHQHLTEMKIAVDARHQGAGARLGETVERQRQCRCAGSEATLARSRSCSRSRTVRVRPIASKAVSIRLLDVSRPLRGIVRAGDLRRERCFGGLARQDRMHLAESAADRRDHGLAVGQQIGFRIPCGFRRGEAVDGARADGRESTPRRRPDCGRSQARRRA